MAKKKARRDVPRYTRPAGRKGEKVMVAFPYGTIEPQFLRSLVFVYVHDATHDKHIIEGGAHLQYQTTNIPHGRNQIVKQFLEMDHIDWLLFVDTDMTFDPDLVDRMLASADPEERPILGALCFSYRAGDVQAIVPTLWSITDDNKPGRFLRVPDEQLFTCAATGTGCVLVHRKVFEAVANLSVPGSDKTYGETSWPWFQYSDWINDKNEPDILGEDITFFFRAAAAGFLTTVDTSIEVGHVKQGIIGKNEYLMQPIADSAPNFVVIPVKGHHDLTDALIEELSKQDEAELIVVLDNGSDTDPYVPRHPRVEVYAAAHMNIHEMWNFGAKHVLGVAPRCNIAFLNNDLSIGKHFLNNLASALRSDPRIMAVSPNYDGRPGEGFQPVTGICAARYDGSGGLAGFAFMVRGELLASSFGMFDERFSWWYGDNDFTLRLDQIGAAYGIALGVECEHLDGGSVTSKDVDLTDEIALDREAFVEKWQAVLT